MIKKITKMFLYILLTLGTAGFLTYHFNPAFGSKINGEKLRELEKSKNFKEGKFQNLVTVDMSMSRGDKSLSKDVKK